MSAFQKALSIVLEWESKYVNDPKDPGGETKFGISKRQYPDLDIASLTLKQAKEIYKRDYWDRCSCELFPEPIAILVFDCAVNQGQSAAINIMQAAYGVEVDGIIGSRTKNAIMVKPAAKIAREFALLRMLRYTTTKNWDKFGVGWTRRLFDVYHRAFEQ